jgi:hypothetical protein
MIRGPCWSTLLQQREPRPLLVGIVDIMNLEHLIATTFSGTTVVFETIIAYFITLIVC